MKLAENIIYAGVNDKDIDLFEGHFDVPNGMAYNSYVIVDDKIAVMDSVDHHFTKEWLDNVRLATKGREPDYLIVQHMEPDHSSSILDFMEQYPNAVVVSNDKSFVMMKNFFGTDFADRRMAVGENDTLSLGAHELHFVTAPMVHWPEVIMTYESKDKILFSADAFGKFGTLDTDEDWACEARRYYFGIVGKYGAQVQAVLKKVAAFDVQTICPLHGPMLTENLGYYLDLYNTWSSYGVESEGIVIAYTSVYGNTRQAVELLAQALEENGCPKVAVNDLAREDMAEAVEDAFRYGTVVLATTTYNADIFPYMRTFIDELLERNFQNKKIAMIENGSWAPAAVRVMKAKFEKSKDITFVEPTVKIMSAVNEETKEQILALAKELCK
ncbi:MAG: FprA family A-type flavoprotein [Ruminococcus sp.]|nr:FprA family A-type flavoprotein [Ruminococcus sp.]